MPTTVTKTVKPSGGDYTSLSAWEAGQQANLVTADQIQQAECYSMQDATACSISGWTTDATRYVRVYTPVSERHDGRRSPDKYRLEVTTGFVPTLTINQDYTRLQGIQLQGAGSGGAPPCNIQVNWVGVGSPRAIIADCIAYDTAGDYGFWVYSGSVAFFNCLSVNNAEGFHIGGGGNANGDFYNCVALHNTTYGFDFGQFNANVIKNCYAASNGTASYNTAAGGPAVTFTSCYSDDGASGTATNGPWATTIAAWSTANFANVTAGFEDPHLADGSALIGAGSDLSSDPNWVHPSGYVDYDGQARVAPWSVGVDEWRDAVKYGGYLGSTPFIGSPGLTQADHVITSAVPAGALIVLAVVCDATITGASDSGGDVGSVDVNTAYEWICSIPCPAGLASGATVSVSITGKVNYDTVEIIAFYLTNVDTSGSRVDGTSTGSQGSNAPAFWNAGTLTSVTNGCIAVISAGSYSNTATSTARPGGILIGSAQGLAVLYDRQQMGRTRGYQGNFSSNPFATMYGVAVAYKIAPVGGGAIVINAVPASLSASASSAASETAVTGPASLAASSLASAAEVATSPAARVTTSAQASSLESVTASGSMTVGASASVVEVLNASSGTVTMSALSTIAGLPILLVSPAPSASMSAAGTVALIASPAAPSVTLSSLASAAEALSARASMTLTALASTVSSVTSPASRITTSGGAKALEVANAPSATVRFSSLAFTTVGFVAFTGIRPRLESVLRSEPSTESVTKVTTPTTIDPV